MTVDIEGDAGQVVGPVPRRLFGSFVEHMGRSVYTGLYEPGHSTSDERGFRGDVLELVRELGPTVLRYPGGNFVSGYRWEDGVGPAETRPVRLDPAWHSVESNRFGLHEFVAWAEAAGTEVMYAVNLGTRGIQEAADVLEYCNIDGGTELSERRRANGADRPFGFKLWCLGNEMDGPWQIGHKTAEEYGRLAAETARLMRMIDPDVELVVAGSSHADMPTFGSWERTVLRHTAELVDHISLHAYYQELHGDTDSYLASAAALDRYIATTAGVIDETLAELGLDKKIGISVDEWNVWDLRRWNEVDQAKLAEGGWKHHPRIIEDTYTVTDAVVVGSLLGSLLRNVDRVTMANQAQLVNVIAPIRSEPGGPAWRQTTFHPFQRVAALAGGASLRLAVEGDRLRTAQHGEVGLVDVAATVEDSGRGAVFLTNRATASPTEVRIRLRGARFGVYAAETLTTPGGETRHTVNTAAAQPVRPVPLPGAAATSDPGGTTITVTLPPLSWSVLQLTPQAGPHA
ncbi:alpha-N-arabinofuranosidase [Amycolatopsis vancoresmycina]|uniref:non-reducing end alpha-L-arabinofuranosidase n=1 Tax=Amycolatopsis vancoresmycina DSM 44592 TaxID=1292037 RepID=R1I515_9PSEU|nr:alpha-L-arabinofuranosidase C-terminal domain-containing protein [Amycolatopsis vancoresmycina]EOD67621.1 alpha-N-arabinofuranosidase [Amycolatopsis vancoresmycina DSM 44592]